MANTDVGPNTSTCPECKPSRTQTRIRRLPMVRIRNRRHRVRSGISSGSREYRCRMNVLRKGGGDCSTIAVSVLSVVVPRMAPHSRNMLPGRRLRKLDPSEPFRSVASTSVLFSRFSRLNSPSPPRLKRIGNFIRRKLCQLPRAGDTCLAHCRRPLVTFFFFF